MKRIILSSLTFVVLSVASHAASITLSAPPVVSGSFDVAVNATDVFANFSDPDDALLAFGFNWTIGSPLISFTGETVNSAFFEDISDCCAPNYVVARDNAAFVFGIESGDFTEPLLLATLHFSVNAPGGSTTIGISADNASDPNLGLIFLGGSEDFSDSVMITTSAAATPEPGTLLIAGLSLAGLYGFRRRFSSR
jgi:PEP-CTERM motif